MRLLLLLFALICTQSLYCISQCSDNTTCLNTSSTSCTTCVNSLFSSCGIGSGTFIISYMQLTTSMTAANGYVMTNSTPYSCSFTYNISNISSATLLYNFPAKMVSTDYIYKTFAIAQPHYYVGIRFSIAFIGVWSATDYLKLMIDDTLQQQVYLLGYNCTSIGVNYTQNLCNTSRSGNHVDCLMAYGYEFNHNTTSLLLNFSSLTNQRDSFVQFWSPFDINIAYKACHGWCTTCYAAGSNNCYSCINTYFLSPNNSCTLGCALPYYKLPSLTNSLTGICVTACPQGYFLSATFICTQCASGCLMCTSLTNCQLSLTSFSDGSNLWKDKIAIWIILILLGVVLIIGLICRMATGSNRAVVEIQHLPSQYNDTKPYDERVTIQEREQAPVQNNNNFYVQEIDFKDHVMVDTNPRKRRRQQRDMNRSTLNL